MMGLNLGAIIIGAVFAGISMLVSNRLKTKFEHYSKVRLQNGLNGRDIAEKMLADHGITDVQVISTPGQLTDHYNPGNKTVNLSEVVYNQVNAAAAAVSAHEVGHAVQHAQAYKWLTMRSKLVPAVNISSKVMNWVILIGLGIAASTDNVIVLGIGIALFAVTTLFAIITLPVEFDASNRALAWMTEKKVVTVDEHAGAADALKWAARTYVVAALGSIATLVYYISRYAGKRR
jgi:Zn-dependent membrane protease YugP